MWQLSHTTATLALKSLTAQVDLSRPDEGLRELSVLGRKSAESRVLCVKTAPVSLADAYVRGSDLVATYTPTATRLLRPQIYWRELEAALDAPLGGVELIVSAQTSLLGVDSSLVVETNLGAAEVLVLRDGDIFSRLNLQAAETDIEQGPGVFLFRPTGVDWSYAELVFPTDFARASLSLAQPNSGLLRLTNRLFPEQLEKGVIRRGRLRGLFLPRAGDEPATLAAYRRFLDSPVPLTT